MEQLKSFLEKDNSELIATVVDDIQRNVETLVASNISFYGYAVLPGNHYTQPDPASIVVAFNREEDIEEENCSDPYYRYSVDEWQNYIHEGFENTNCKLASEIANFRELYTLEDETDDEYDYETEFFDKVNSAILKALLVLKEKGVFGDGTYLVVWFSDSSDKIMDQSAKALNSEEVFNHYIKEFG